MGEDEGDTESGRGRGMVLEELEMKREGREEGCEEGENVSERRNGWKEGECTGELEAAKVGSLSLSRVGLSR